jgi:hypothetical protein
MGRKLTDEQKARRAAKMENNRRVKEAPLFVASGVLAETTEREQFQRLQLTAAMAAENCGELTGRRILESLTDHRMRRECAAMLSPEVWSAVSAYVLRTYPSTEYWCMAWKRILEGDVQHYLDLIVWTVAPVVPKIASPSGD